MPKVPTRPIRYSVVGLGHIAQVAILPGFAHAKKNSRLPALVSGEHKARPTSTPKLGPPRSSYEGEASRLIRPPRRQWSGW
jgi:hypothetical protein